MSLSPEERRKIYEEEKERAEARKKVQKELEAKESKEKLKNGCAGCLTLIVLVVILGWIFGGSSDKSQEKSPPQSPSSVTKPSPPETINLAASIRFTGTQFVIENRNGFHWTNVEMSVNSGLFGGGYKLHVDMVEAGTDYTVGALQFATSDGERFNPFRTKPQKFTVWADTPKGRGLYVGSFR